MFIGLGTVVRMFYPKGHPPFAAPARQLRWVLRSPALRRADSPG